MTRLILMTASDYSDGSVERAILEPLGAELKITGCKTEADVVAAGKDAYGLMVTYTPIREQVMTALTGLKVIVRCGIGVDNLDLVLAKKRGIAVCNVPDYCLDEVADHAMALLLALERQLIPQNEDIRAGAWKGIKGALGIRGLQGSVLGVVGLGQIGRRMASRAQAFGMKVIAFDPFVRAEDVRAQQIELTTLDELLAQSDYISLHPPLTPENFHIINADALAKMKPNACLINTSRGPLVDRAALLQALKNGRIAGAGLDVVEDDLEGTRELSQLPNVINTPHTAWFSQYSFNQLRIKSAEEMARFLRGEPLRHPLT